MPGKGIGDEPDGWSKTSGERRTSSREAKRHGARSGKWLIKRNSLMQSQAFCYMKCCFYNVKLCSTSVIFRLQMHRAINPMAA